MSIFAALFWLHYLFIARNCMLEIRAERGSIILQWAVNETDYDGQ
jgi:hypothetical protein